ncbi:hypothetical protein [Kitasatospora sp. NPDC093679]|uniref:hypothetical protein n=1 Tax=Kitasatospora sp. NPDC093679 TaxID=3154983 RepID=UPI00343759D8
MSTEQAAAWAARAVDTVLDQMETGQTPNAADVLAANVALFAAERDGIPAADWQRHLRPRG